MTLEELATAVERAPSQLSMIETGKREPKLTLLRAIAKALGATVDQLLEAETLDERATLEIALERAMKGPTFRALGIDVPHRQDPPRRRAARDARAAGEIERLGDERSATPEEARRANVELRHLMRRQDNYFAELEEHARGILRAVDHPGGPLTQRTASDIAAHLGFSLHYVADLPASTRSVADIKQRPALPVEHGPGEGRLAHGGAAGAREPDPRAQRAAIVRRVPASARRDELPDRRAADPEDHAAPVLQDAKARRAISIEDLRDAYSVSYETAAHRFTNLATRHLGIRVHFLKVHESGTITKAYENDDVNFPPTGSARSRASCAAALDEPRRLRHPRQVQPVLPVHRHRQRHVLVHGARRGVERGRALRVGRCALRRHEVVRRPRDDQPGCLAARRRGVLPPPPAELEGQWRDQAWPNVRTRGRSSRPCPPVPSPGSTRPTCTSSSRRTRRGSDRAPDEASLAWLAIGARSS
jgi:transcriptional regulator with XRE-family HTH domain